MSLEPAVIAGYTTAIVAASGGLLAWVARIAEGKGKRFAEKRDERKDGLSDRDGLIDQLQEQLERAHARTDKLQERLDAEQKGRREDWERDRAEIERIDKKAHMANRKARHRSVRVFDLEAAVRDLDPSHPVLTYTEPENPE